MSTKMKSRCSFLAILALVFTLLSVPALAQRVDEAMVIDDWEGKSILLLASNTNIRVLPSEDGKVRCEYNKEMSLVDMRVEAEGLVIDIQSATEKAPDFSNTVGSPILYLPVEALEHFALDATHTQVFLPPVNAHMDIKTTAGSFSNLIIPKDFDKTANVEMVDSEGYLVLNMDASDYTVTVNATGGLLDVPGAFPKYDNRDKYTYVDGTGEKQINVTTTDTTYHLMFAKE